MRYLALLMSLACRPGGAVPAFPGAEGFGAEVSGGRGGKVVHVTNLAAQGPGSLQEALDQTGRRTIVFDVSGVVKGVPQLSHGDVTMAGQTSPGGITLRGLMVQGEVVEEADNAPLPHHCPSNFIIRHVRLRSPLRDGSDGDGLRLHHARNGIIDHVSIGNAEDEAVQVSFASNITIQNCIIAETLGSHADLGGMLLNYGDPRRGFPLTRLSIHHNLFSRISGRLPEMSRESPGNTGSTMQVEISNNLYYDPHFPIWMCMTSKTDGPADGYASAPIHYQANLVGNYFWQNPRSPRSFGLLTIEGAHESCLLPKDAPTRIYLRDNATNLAPARDWQLVYGCNDWLPAWRNKEMPHSQPPFFAAPQRLPFPVIAYTPVDQLREVLQKSVGAFPRDAMDTRLLGYLKAQQFPAAAGNVNPNKDSLLTLPAGTLPKDQDRDGMPDSWESSRGLRPSQDDSAGHQLDPTYTNLEVYLESLAQSRH